MRTSIAALVIFLLGSMNFAQADERGPGAKEFHKLITTFRQSCVNECTPSFKAEVVFDVEKAGFSTLTEDEHMNLKNIAVDQAQIWGDTILEGDYYSSGETQLDRVIALYLNEILIGYRITYSEQAWFTAECDFQGDDERTLRNCSEGRIYESTFASADFKTYFRDDKDFATFKE